MRKSIAIIELYQHDEVLRHYCDMLSDSDYNIKVFCSKSVFENIQDFVRINRFDWYIMESRESIPSFLKANQSIIRTVDLIYITTVLNHFKTFYKLSKTGKTLLLLHNAHSFLAPEKHIYFEKPVMDRLRWLKIYFNRAHFYKKKMLDALAGLAFPNKKILEYVKKKFEVPLHLKLLELPFAYFGKRAKISHEEITITIPGTVNPALRDYQIVLDAFLQLRGKFKQKIQLVLLGETRKSGKRIVESFEILKNGQIELLTFNHFIPQKDFEKWLLSTDFLILPFKSFARNHIYKEHWGYSKISGSINDVIRFGIPALISASYPLEEALKPMTSSFSNAGELAEKIQSWIIEKRYLNRREQVSLYLDKYSHNNRSKHFLDQLNRILYDKT